MILVLKKTTPFGRKLVGEELIVGVENYAEYVKQLILDGFNIDPMEHEYPTLYKGYYTIHIEHHNRAFIQSDETLIDLVKANVDPLPYDVGKW